MNSLESWNDNRFTELEAHVEAEGSRRQYELFWPRIFRNSGIWLEKSLSKAIEKSNERLVLLEGDPGSGKSVALRHVTQLMARKAPTSRNLRTRIPIYVNLKYLRRAEGENIDRLLLEKFIFKTLNRVNDRDVDEFLHDEFKRGLEEGAWFFLFDSFDEIPEILSSTGTDEVIRNYAEAIRDFLHGMNNCKGIVASREYKGPRFLGWPKFRILPLESSRRVNLVHRTNLPLNIQKSIIDGLAISIDDFRVMASNPMFLNLICDFMNKPIIPEFPKHIHMVFQEYVRKRLTRDEERVKGRFNKTPQDVQDAAEKYAYCMTADQGIGLSPTLEQLEDSTIKMNLNLGEDFSVFVEALAYLKLARIDTSFVDGNKTFTFAHRRFQEYFATAVVLRDTGRVSDVELITNGRWRETAVVILQTQSNERKKAILGKSDELLNTMIENFGDLFSTFEPSIVGNNEYLKIPECQPNSLLKHIFEPFEISRKRIRAYIQAVITAYEFTPIPHLEKDVKAFTWPNHLYHVISILQDGLSNHQESLPKSLRDLLDRILVYISEKGDIIDEKMCLELIGLSSEKIKIHLLTKAITRGGRYTRRIAFRRINALRTIPDVVSRFIRSSLFEMAFNLKLFESRHETYAQLSMLENSKKYRDMARLLAWAPIIDLFLFISAAIVVGVISKLVVVFLVLLLALSVWRITWYFEGARKSPATRLISWLLLIIVAYYFTFLGNLFSLLKYSPSSVGFWYFVAAISWGTYLFYNVISGNKVKTQPYYWPFYGLLPAAGLFLIILFIKMAPQFLSYINIDWLKNEYGWISQYQIFVSYSLVVLVLISLLDIIYIISRIWIIYSEIPPIYRRSQEVFSFWLDRQSLNFVTIWYMLVGIVLAITIVGTKPEIFFSAFVGIVLIYMFYNVYKSGISNVNFPNPQDYVRSILGYLTWRKNVNQMDFLDFIRDLNSFRVKFIRRWMIRHVIDKQLVRSSVDNINHLRNLISFGSVNLNYRYLLTSARYEKYKEQYQKWQHDLNQLDPVLYTTLDEVEFSVFRSLTLSDLCEIFEQISSLHNN